MSASLSHSGLVWAVHDDADNLPIVIFSSKELARGAIDSMGVLPTRVFMASYPLDESVEELLRGDEQWVVAYEENGLVSRATPMVAARWTPPGGIANILPAARDQKVLQVQVWAKTCEEAQVKAAAVRRLRRDWKGAA